MTDVPEVTAAQPPSALADDARKIAEALRDLLDCPDIADNDYRDEETHEAERKARAALPLAESLPGKIEALERERDEALSDTHVGLTVGNGLVVYGSVDAIMRVQTFILLDSKHPQEIIDTNRLFARALQAAEAQLAARDAEIARLREALKPFAEVCQDNINTDPDKWRDSEALWESPAAMALTVGDLRRADATLHKRF